MLFRVKYSDIIFNKIKNIQSGPLSINVTYRKGYNYISCIAINLIIVTNNDGMISSLIYEDVDHCIVHRPIRERINLHGPCMNIIANGIYNILFTELKKYGVTVMLQENDDGIGYTILYEEVFGPAYFNLDGYTICCFNNDYMYNNLKPLGTFFGHILTNQPFSYQKFLSNLFTDDEESTI